MNEIESLKERIKELEKKNDELCTICAETYQAVGAMLNELNLFDSDQGTKLMDNLSQQELVHKDILPFTFQYTEPEPLRVHTNGDREFSLKNRQFSHEGKGYIQDNNFDFDAGLQVSGDFLEGEKEKYAEMICVALNTQSSSETPKVDLTRVDFGQSPVSVRNGEEEKSFEKWASIEKYDLSTRTPTSPFYTDPTTKHARRGWAAAVHYCERFILEYLSKKRD